MTLAHTVDPRRFGHDDYLDDVSSAGEGSDLSKTSEPGTKRIGRCLAVGIQCRAPGIESKCTTPVVGHDRSRR
jgi:hypothetical protein